jgi:hypothetical protein
MVAFHSSASMLWASIADALDIPQSLYEKAVARHQSLGDWFCRPQSGLAAYGPSVRPQGSFRFGTVIRPIDVGAEYDLDHVVVLQRLSTGAVTQAELKRLHGVEMAAYALAHKMLPPTEHNRCWRARYRDEVAFHLDSLPCVPAGVDTWAALRRIGVEGSLATRAIALTDRRHPQFAVNPSQWLTSNPRGFARWFESRAMMSRDQGLLERIRAGQVEDVPPYEWKTPLQRSIQILKRHRDVMFRQVPAIAPISMIITNLAACAYEGETDLTDALRGILARMPNFVRRAMPRVPNPTHPEEDYADKWQRNPRLEPSFWEWHTQAKADVERFSTATSRSTVNEVKVKFDIPITGTLEMQLAGRAPAVILSSTTATRIADAPKPWGYSKESLE